MYKILTTKDEEWNKILEKTSEPDIYFTREYARIYEDNYSKQIDEAFCGESILFFSGDKNNFVTFLTIKRPIKLDKTYFDLITPYNYGGPLIKVTNKSKEEVIQEFQANLKDFCKKNNIVTEFIRFHPVLKNHEHFKDSLNIDKRNPTVIMNLEKDKESLLKDMHKKTRNLIRKAEKNNITIELSKDIKKFTNLYLETMQKVNAPEKFHFPLEFFKNTVKHLDKNISLFTATHKEKIIAASLFMHKYDSIHYHFSGTDSNYRNLAPNQLLLWKVALWAKEKGYKNFHLGGGVNPNQEKDPLFHFKSGFSKDRLRFHTASVIHDNKAYKRLNILRDTSKKQDKIIDFFPYYRG
ncbi:GNAT family N-acetyltransferase [archaeon]|nr:GNAT family N-acetyltransferase [archaeon]